MILTRQELRFYIMADRIMNGLPAKKTLKERIGNIVFAKPPIMAYLKAMRVVSFSKHQSSLFSKVILIIYRHKYNRLGLKLGFFINEDVCRYGMVVPHYGTIVIGGNNRIGRYAVFHTVVNMTASNCVVGDGLYLSVGAKVIGPLTLGDNVTIAANSVVKGSFDNNVLLVGSPAVVKRKDYSPWYERDGERFSSRVKSVEQLRIKLGIRDDC